MRICLTVEVGSAHTGEAVALLSALLALEAALLTLVSTVLRSSFTKAVVIVVVIKLRSVLTGLSCLVASSVIGLCALVSSIIVCRSLRRLFLRRLFDSRSTRYSLRSIHLGLCLNNGSCCLLSLLGLGFCLGRDSLLNLLALLLDSLSLFRRLFSLFGFFVFRRAILCFLGLFNLCFLYFLLFCRLLLRRLILCGLLCLFCGSLRLLCRLFNLFKLGGNKGYTVNIVVDAFDLICRRKSIEKNIELVRLQGFLSLKLDALLRHDVNDFLTLEIEVLCKLICFDLRFYCHKLYPYLSGFAMYY